MAYGTRAPKEYLNTYGDKFIKKAAADMVDALKIEREGKTYYEYHYNRVDGYITDIRRESKPVNWKGKETAYFLEIDFKDNDENFTLSMIWDSAPARGVLYRLENIDPSKRVEIHIGSSNDRRPFVWAYHIIGPKHKEKITSAYTKAVPNGKPEWIAREINGEMYYDKTAETDFLIKVMEAWKNNISPALIDFLANDK